MTLQTCLIAAVIVLFRINQTRACLQINTSCPAIQTPNGFMFTYMIPEGSNISEIYVYHNKTTIAHAVPRKNKFEYLSDVESMGDTSVVTRDCKDLKALCILRNGPHIIEHCVDYKITVTGEMKMSDSSKLWGLAKEKFHRQREEKEKEEEEEEEEEEKEEKEEKEEEEEEEEEKLAWRRGYLSAPDVNEASNQALDRSSERSGSQDYVNEGQQLLSNQRISVPDFDNEGEAERLVNKRGVDQFTTVLDTDEESMTSSMKNHNTIKP
ncbi:hypothetical protein PAMA_009675 [Pampus argenteus]